MVPKKTGQVRICGNFKLTVNSQIEVEKHPLPKPADLFATLAGCTVFSKGDLTKVYHQMKVSEESRKILVINTHKGLFCYNRLPFGIASCPSIFQAAMEQILQGIPRTVVFQDDIQVGGRNQKENLSILDQVLTRLNDHGIKHKKEKCELVQNRVEYLGHVIDAEGLNPIQEKVKAVLDAPVPINKSQLRSFLGMVQYYSRFIKRLSTLVGPLNNLLKNSTAWKWTSACDGAFNDAKAALSSADVLTHYDVDKKMTLACDASNYGLGAVISHVLPDGTEKPIAYASRTLETSERNYAQIEKEALSIIFGVKRFHEYLYGRSFSLITDHKPLLAILGPKKGVPTLAAARMQRWALILSAYTYDIEFRKTDEHCNADMLSRLPVLNTEGSEEDPIFHFTNVDALPLTSKNIRDATQKDPILSRVLNITLSGWPNNVADQEMKPYFLRKNELSVEQGIVLWGLRVIVPTKLRTQLLEEVHSEHPGIVRMKALARSYMWWPLLDRDMELKVKSCLKCTSVKNTPSTAPLHQWPVPNEPWERVNVDYAEYKGRYYFVLVDAYTKWPKLHLVTTTTTRKTVQVLRQIFATHGVPRELVSDNGPQFVSDEFSTFLEQNGITHRRSPPYHPATNGAAERFVQVLKNSLKRSDTVTLSNRTTPHTLTGKSPAELLFKRRIRTRLDLIQPNLKGEIVHKQQQQRLQRNEKKSLRISFLENMWVFEGSEDLISGLMASSCKD